MGIETRRLLAIVLLALWGGFLTSQHVGDGFWWSVLTAVPLVVAVFILVPNDPSKKD